MKILEVMNLSKSFKDPNGNKLKVLKDISFKMNKGDVLGIVGESGSGKTTLGRAILRLIEIDSGSILYNNINITNFSKTKMKVLRKDIQVIFQDPFGSLNPRHSIKTILSEPLVVHKFGNAIKIQRRISELLDQVGLPKNSLELYPHEFSGGQRQRIAIARALSLKPKFIVADEAVSALDVSIQSQIINLISKILKDYGLSMIFISHDLSVIKHISNKIAVMNKGEIVEIGDTIKTLKNPKHNYTRMLISSVPGMK
tara:strand:- start:1127 stop:1894 length:768 start_codon:yes stop_codon:yes gene_type:complete